MKLKKGCFTLVLLCVCLSLSCCSFSGTPAPVSAATGGVRASAAPSLAATPAPTPSPAATLTQAVTAAPTPSPTSTPDPWAEMFNPSGPYVQVPDPVNGPWVYKDATLSVTIQLKRGGPSNFRYYVAEIYTRGPLFHGGFAYQDNRDRKTELPYRIARRYQAVFGITSDYLTWPDNPKGVMIRDGKVYFDKAKVTTLAMMPDGDMKLFEPGEATAAQLLGLGVKDSFAFGPVLIRNGEITEDAATNRLRPLNYRAALGQVEPGHYICITTLGAFTLTQLAQLFEDYHCTMAYNMDGGHSACMIFMGEQLNRQFPGLVDNIQQRPLPDLMLLGACAAVPGPNDHVYSDGINVHPKVDPWPKDGPVN